MTDLSRRTFLSTTSRGTIAWPVLRHFDLAWTPPLAQPTAKPFVIFDEPGFPVVDTEPLRAIPGARACGSVAELTAALEPGVVLVWRHGSAFPADGWSAIAGFLENGGALLHVGGEPFTRPVSGTPGSRRVEPRTVAQLQVLRLNQSYRIEVGGAALRRAGVADTATRTFAPGAWVSALEPRFTDTVDFPSESGSPGARDALLRPLAYAVPAGSDPRFPSAAVAYAIDRLRGPFAGGRWVFWLASEAPRDDDWPWLLAEAQRPAVDLRVDPTFGCFHAGEQPALVVRAHRPASREALTVECAIAIAGAGAPMSASAPLTVEEHGTVLVPLVGSFAPGLYRVTVDAGPLGRATTGFWVFDQALFASGDALSVDDYSLRRNGAPEPIVGTTTMSATVHRDFLFEPNAAAWDDGFAEMASVGMNAIRTGLWSGWKRITSDANVVDEAFLRALEAYYLTARKHRLAVIFTLFAFVPEEFGGDDPYFDPRALEGQRAFLSTLARRMAPARELVWDLINEPSFASPRELWSLRPVRTADERRAFTAWLRARYAVTPGTAGSWQETVRRRWRLSPDEPIDLPTNDDFVDTWVIGARRPYRAFDYALFAQDAFEGWIRSMSEAIRDGGSRTPITVGQDEAGLGLSPAPLFHHASVDFTSMHTWWNSDALLWDGLLSKATGTPLLISETGIMQRQHLSAEAVRSPEDFAAILSRKIAYGFAAGAFGVIQWCYETNPFMNSDNEAAIGVKRVDGSVKPEHAVLAAAARFVTRNRARFDGYIAPDVVVLVPSAEQLSPRSLGAQAVRTTVRAFYESLGIPLRAVPDHRASRDLGNPKVIVLPACRSISDDGWGAVLAAVEQGATLACSGWFETDDAGLPAERLGGAARSLRAIEQVRLANGGVATFRFPGITPESWYAARFEAPRHIARGAGTIVHHPLPIEWAEPTEAIADFYRQAIGNRVMPRIRVEGEAAHTVVVVTVPFRDAWLVVAVNESSSSRQVRLRRASGQSAPLAFDVAAGQGRMAIVDPRRWSILDLS